MPADFYTKLVAEALGISEEDVTSEMRYRAKQTVFTAIYGQQGEEFIKHVLFIAQDYVRTGSVARLEEH